MFRRKELKADVLVLELLRSYGNVVGATIIDTAEWGGRFIEAFGGQFCRMTRKEVASRLCGTGRAGDKEVRQAVIDLYGGKDIAIGGPRCKRCHGKGKVGREHLECPRCGGSGWEHPPGPLRDLSRDMWSALALTLAYVFKVSEEKGEEPKLSDGRFWRPEEGADLQKEE